METPARKVLRETFGFHEFRAPQEDIIEHLIAGNDAFVLLPTGSGKSLCYQIPALVRPGMALIVSPLQALMDNQVAALRSNGVKASAFHSGLTTKQANIVRTELERGELKLLYVSPERLMNEWFPELLSKLEIALIAVDEAHCVSAWGHDFRPEYLRLREVFKHHPGVPRIALTATADVPTRADIVARLDMRQARSFHTGFDRPNIRYRIVIKSDPHEQLWRFLREGHEGSTGIVYRTTRDAVEETAEWLARKGLKAVPYHAGMPDRERSKNLTRFLEEDGVVMVATIAFGMGIDKPDVRFVAHLDLPKNVEGYYQETGRAGRDGLASEAWMAYGMKDLMVHLRFIDSSDADDAYKRILRTKLNALLAICETTGCRRQAILGYFGQNLAEPCGNCDTCLEPVQGWDATIAAQKALSAMVRTGGWFGNRHVIDVLRGEKTDKVAERHHHELPTFGVGKDLAEKTWTSVIRQLVANGYAAPPPERAWSLMPTETGMEVLRGKRTVQMREESVTVKKTAKVKKRGKSVATYASAAGESDEDIGLYEKLRSLRGTIAKSMGVPPYVVFSDATLRDMVRKRPTDLRGFLEVDGVGPTKAQRHGDEFLAILGGSGDMG